MDIAKKYKPSGTEEKWYAYWQEHGVFHSEPHPEKEPYTIVIPPPNVTGVLHMGHMLNNTIQDVLIRRARMQGKAACWVPGTDHASIATEAKVVKKLESEGKSKWDLGREEFLKEAWAWTEEYGGTILRQLKKLGASCDWERTTFTLDDHYYQAVIKVFVQLYKEGYIYKGARMVNWDPQSKTALSDEEVIHVEQQGKLYHIQYAIEGSEGSLEIATTRPETIFADTAIAVHSEDERYAHLIGQKALIPLLNKQIPIIGDDYIDLEFGTGCLKVTPAHDINDYEIGQRHNLESVNLLNEDGTLNENGHQYAGMDRFAVRKQISKDLKAAGALVKEEDYTNKVGTSERTGAVIEPRISEQWFVRMQDLVKPALEAIESGSIRLHPEKFLATYKHWIENIRDWCISRQLWWGQRIPAYYLPDGELVVAETKEQALEKARELKGGDFKEEDLQQDPDVLDTWFSSWLWPMEVFKGISEPENPEFNYYYPTHDLVTAPEILFFWVSRMIISGYHFKDQKPFSNVYLHGIVRDSKGKKMSKSLGNSPDPIGLIDEYGADGVRTGMLFSSPAGNDLKFDVKLCEQGRNFNNKVWNALRLVKGWEVEEQREQDLAASYAVKWFAAVHNQVKAELETLFDTYRISDALMLLYRHVWDNFCSWYLEMVKPAYGEPIDAETLDQTIAYFEELLALIHPFMPFISEEIWHNLRVRPEGATICREAYPQAERVENSEDLLQNGEWLQELTSAIRNLRSEVGLSPYEPLKLIASEVPENQELKRVLGKIAHLDSFEKGQEPEQQHKKVLVKRKNYYICYHKEVDVEAEKQRIEKEIDRLSGFLKGVRKKLSNERFVENAPDQVVEKERQKEKDSLQKMEQLKEELNQMVD